MSSSPSDSPPSPPQLCWLSNFMCCVVSTALYYVEFFLGGSRVCYRLATKVNGPDYNLALVSRTGRLQLVPTEDSPLQYWQISPTIFPKMYRLQVECGGRAYSVEVRLQGPEDTAGIPGPVPILTQSRYLRSQFWRIQKDHPGSTTFRLTNGLTGPNMFLDIYQLQDPVMIDGDNPTMQWALTMGKMD
ncbi:hypothetical protein M422DRAFT_53364 [Sphaerobolus stellatus SS14]|uniref:Ricin B lectin domain-containing protein n=1 Tax=Sphaerobolus stellatus (strain SS14) TaxID=990650 RepID=A0A0C9UQT6_SPHS4|nr:hypothetical protein M422DRAFT_53364 [Sphaerobolus stellatus SS14]